MPKKKTATPAKKKSTKPKHKGSAASKKQPIVTPPTTPAKKANKLLRRVFFISLIVFLSLGSVVLAGYIYLLDRIYPGVSVGNINLTGLTLPEAQDKLNQVFLNESTPLRLSYQLSDSPSPRAINIDPALFIRQVNINQILQTAYAYGHSKFYDQPVHLKLAAFTSPSDSLLPETVTSQVDQPAVNSKVILNNNTLDITPSQSGHIIDQDQLAALMYRYLSEETATPKELPIKSVEPIIKAPQAQTIKQTLTQVMSTPVTLTFVASSSGVPLNQVDTVALDFPTLYSMLQTNDSQIKNPQLTLDQSKLTDYLNSLATSVNRQVEEPIFEYDSTSNKVTNFQAPQEGRDLDISLASQALTQGLNSPDPTHIKIPVDIIPTQNKLVNQMGIKELLGEGVSHFAGSTPERIFNLSLAASRINGALVAPGDTFSFDKTVGEISGATGYKEGYIIQNGRTVLDDGGGVCQDPTTLFRAVLYAGLPVIDRTAHAYRVEYYEEGFPPGLDATIYSPTVDFKFKNDTKNYILIETHVDTATNTLYYDLYGTPDGRVAKLTTPVITNVTPAPPPLYQNDPTLPVGVTKQTDYAVNGANVMFSRTVTRNDQTLIQETYHSNYKPWQAVYLVGTKT